MELSSTIRSEFKGAYLELPSRHVAALSASLKCCCLSVHELEQELLFVWLLPMSVQQFNGEFKVNVVNAL
ncbi:hypothetical protein TNCV_2930681 [Trichonephila clavipes]|nr:hypothetical protein TNCV_2930681 [Trichonephila clavipes]